MAPWRGKRLVDGAAYAASALGDHGFVWFLVGVVRGRNAGFRRAVAIRAVVFTGVVVPGVNAALKSAVGRVRPEREGRHSLPVRVPRTASFPSGHSLAAWCAATLLAEDDPWAPAYYLLAGAVSASRVHVRLHHATDVVAGSLLGIALGWVGRRIVPARGAIMTTMECADRSRG
jgi:undecaprenyl-diphosphatase